jgi:hypothetical protein
MPGGGPFWWARQNARRWALFFRWELNRNCYGGGLYKNSSESTFARCFQTPVASVFSDRTLVSGIKETTPLEPFWCAQFPLHRLGHDRRGRDKGQ